MKYLLIFIILTSSLCSIWIVPNFFSKKELSFDNIMSYAHIEAWKNYWLYKHNVSGDPKQVIVGANDFLFLGDFHNQSFSNAYNLNAESYLEMENSKNSFEVAIKNITVPIVFFIVPSKASIYPEYLPTYIPNKRPPFDYILQSLASHEFMFTNREDLLSKKERGLIYKPWDSHWNEKGAYLGYQFLMGKINSLMQVELQVFDKVKFEYTQEYLAGDLSRMLKFDYFSEEFKNENFTKYNHKIKDNYLQERSNIIQTLYDSKSLVATEDDVITVNRKTFTNYNAMHTQNLTAVNNQSIIWIADSFGTEMSVYMQETFANTFQIHPQFINNERKLKLLSEKFKPDYIIFTVAERYAPTQLKRLSRYLQ